jgi:hypothetical protein
VATVEGPFVRQDEDPTVMAMLCAVQDEVLQQPQARDSWREQVDRLQEEQQVSLLYNDVMQQKIKEAVAAIEEADPPEPPEQLTPPPKKKRQGCEPTDLVPLLRVHHILQGWFGRGYFRCAVPPAQLTRLSKAT